LAKQPHHCNAQKVVCGQICRYRRDWRKEKALTGGDLKAVKCNERSAEVIVITENEPASDRNPESRRSHERNEGLNVKKFLMRHGFSAMK
jgi:hypothetical protein